MGRHAEQARRATRRKIRGTCLTEEEKAVLRGCAVYEGSPQHKRNPGDFGLIPPASPRPDKTLCDEAGIFKLAQAQSLLDRAINGGLVSEADIDGLPKQLWAVDEDGRVFEAMLGGSRRGCFHGYPIRKSDPLYGEIVSAWEDPADGTT